MGSRKKPQLDLEFRPWGGRRRGAGRPQIHRRCSEAHRTREVFPARSPVHVTLRVVDGIGTLRCVTAYHAIRTAMEAIHGREGFRVVHASIQHDHLHLLNEADDRMALGRGMQALQISIAHHLKATLPYRHEGRVFIDRYHPEIIDTPTQAHHALAYVLLNWRKHDQDRGVAWRLDPYSSAISFTGFAESIPGHGRLHQTTYRFRRTSRTRGCCARAGRRSVRSRCSDARVARVTSILRRLPTTTRTSIACGEPTSERRRSPPARGFSIRLWALIRNRKLIRLVVEGL
jgi:REP element-mobilizing transposase RayT